MPLQGSGAMSFADVYNEMTGESLTNPPISITAAELGQLQNSANQTIPLNTYYTPRPDGNLPTIFPTEWYLYCQRCNAPNSYLTIQKSAPSGGNLNQVFSYFLTITNNGTTATTAPIQISDYLQEGLVYITYVGSGWSIDVQQYSIDVNRYSYNVFGTYNGVLQPNGVLVLEIRVNPTITKTYNNYASVSGGGESVSKSSNTTTTLIGGSQTWTSSKSKIVVRTFQKNNCDVNGIGSYVDVYSPSFTATYTSSISQVDADTNANNNATTLCNNWLDANGQNEANSRGTCDYEHPQLTLSKYMPQAFNVNQSGQVEIIARTFGNSTSGQIIISDIIPSGFSFVDLNLRPPEWAYDIINGNTIRFICGNVLASGYYGRFLFTIRANIIGNYTNVATAYGGNILNNSATSNSVSTYIFGNPVFSFSAGTGNQTYYNGTNGNIINAAPTDQVYHSNILTINTQDSTPNSIVKIEFRMPQTFRVIDDVQVFYPTDYFDFSQGVNSYTIVFTQKNNVIVPVGQYGFYIFFSLPINYFAMSSTSQNENLRPDDNLILNANGFTIPRKETTLISNYVNNTLKNSIDQTITWANNYTFLPIFESKDTNNDTRIPNDVNGLTYTYAVNNQANYSQPITINFINQHFFSIDEFYVVNPTRDTSPGVVNIDYPYTYVVSGFPSDSYMFGIRIYYRIYKDGILIKSFNDSPNSYLEIKIDKTKNEPKYRNVTFIVRVDTNGNYIY